MYQSSLRNVGVFAHIDAGKTTLTERLLHVAGASDYLGDVDDGTATTDWMPEEQRRGISITAAAARLVWRGAALNLIDTPGHVDFSLEVERSLRVLDGAVLLVSRVEGVQSQTELIWRQLCRHGVPALVFVNKMDRDGWAPDALIDELGERLHARAIAVQLPWLEDGRFCGVIDLMAACAYRWDDRGRGQRVRPEDHSDELRETIELYRDDLVEQLTVFDEELLTAAVGGEGVPPDALTAAVGRCVARREVVPVLWGAAKPLQGVEQLLRAMVELLPSSALADTPSALGRGAPAPFSAFAFKVQRLPGHGRVVFLRCFAGVAAQGASLTVARDGQRLSAWRAHHVLGIDLEEVPAIVAGDVVAVTGLEGVRTGDTLRGEGSTAEYEALSALEPVIMVSIEPEHEGGLSALQEALEDLCEEDPSLTHRLDPLTGQSLLAGMGELHLTIAVERLGAALPVSIRVGKPRVSMRTTVAGEGSGEAELNRETSDGLLAVRVALRIEPAARGAGVVVRGLSKALPSEVHQAVYAGVAELERAQGRIAHPLCDLTCTISALKVQGGDQALSPLRACVVAATQRAIEEAGELELEPWMRVQVEAPLDCTGPILGDLRSRGAQIDEVTTIADRQRIEVGAPLSEMTGYASDLRSLTQGKGEFSMRFDRYQARARRDGRDRRP